MAPVEVNPSNQEEVWLKLYTPTYAPKTPKFSGGDSVRITKSRLSFHRGYTPNWSREIFTISEILNTSPITYTIKDLSDEAIDGSFYEQELQKVDKPTIFEVETVLANKIIRGRKYVLVKWLGYPEKFNQWIPQSYLSSIS